MLHRRPQNPTMVLIISIGFIAAGSVKNTFFGIEITRQRDGSLIMKPGLKALRCFLMVTAPVQVEHHHARFVSVISVVEGADARQTPVAPRLNFRINQKMS